MWQVDARPPTRLAFSKTETSAPPADRLRAQARPDIPAPMTATRIGLSPVLVALRCPLARGCLLVPVYVVEYVLPIAPVKSCLKWRPGCLPAREIVGIRPWVLLRAMDRRTVSGSIRKASVTHGYHPGWRSLEAHPSALEKVMSMELLLAWRRAMSGVPVTRPTHPTVQLLPGHGCGEFASRQHALKHEVTRTESFKPEMPKEVRTQSNKAAHESKTAKAPRAS